MCRSGRRKLSRAARLPDGLLRRTYRSPETVGSGSGEGCQRTPISDLRPHRRLGGQPSNSAIVSGRGTSSCRSTRFRLAAATIVTFRRCRVRPGRRRGSGRPPTHGEFHWSVCRAKPTIMVGPLHRAVELAQEPNCSTNEGPQANADGSKGDGLQLSARPPWQSSAVVTVRYCRLRSS
jgi:hypothetical protein